MTNRLRFRNVRVGLETRRPFAVEITDNDQIGFLRYGVRSPAPAPEQVQVRPNPASDRVRLSLPSGTDEPVQVQLFDLAGRLVLEATEILGDGILHLNLTTVKTGLYICRVSTAGRRFAPLKLSIIR
jgi:hypothetical protein